MQEIPSQALRGTSDKNVRKALRKVPWPSGSDVTPTVDEADLYDAANENEDDPLTSSTTDEDDGGFSQSSHSLSKCFVGDTLDTDSPRASPPSNTSVADSIGVNSFNSSKSGSTPKCVPKCLARFKPPSLTTHIAWPYAPPSGQAANLLLQCTTFPALAAVTPRQLKEFHPHREPPRRRSSDLRRSPLPPPHQPHLDPPQDSSHDHDHPPSLTDTPLIGGPYGGPYGGSYGGPSKTFHRSAVILDWDDTLFPSSWMHLVQQRNRPPAFATFVSVDNGRRSPLTQKVAFTQKSTPTQSSQSSQASQSSQVLSRILEEPSRSFIKRHCMASGDQHHLMRVEASVMNLLSVCLEHKCEIYIVTNAEPGWVELSASMYMPRVAELCSTHALPIVSAREFFEKRYQIPGQSTSLFHATVPQRFDIHEDLGLPISTYTRRGWNALNPLRSKNHANSISFSPAKSIEPAHSLIQHPQLSQHSHHPQHPQHPQHTQHSLLGPRIPRIGRIAQCSRLGRKNSVEVSGTLGKQKAEEKERESDCGRGPELQTPVHHAEPDLWKLACFLSLLDQVLQPRKIATDRSDVPRPPASEIEPPYALRDTHTHTLTLANEDAVAHPPSGRMLGAAHSVDDIENEIQSDVESGNNGVRNRYVKATRLRRLRSAPKALPPRVATPLSSGGIAPPLLLKDAPAPLASVAPLLTPVAHLARRSRSCRGGLLGARKCALSQVLSVGDSESERTALLRCRSWYYDSAVFKSIKFVEKSHPTLLRRQIEYLANSLPQFLHFADAIDLVFDAPVAQVPTA